MAQSLTSSTSVAVNTRIPQGHFRQFHEIHRMTTDTRLPVREREREDNGKDTLLGLVNSKYINQMKIRHRRRPPVNSENQYGHIIIPIIKVVVMYVVRCYTCTNLRSCGGGGGILDGWSARRLLTSSSSAGASRSGGAAAGGGGAAP